MPLRASTAVNCIQNLGMDLEDCYTGCLKFMNALGDTRAKAGNTSASCLFRKVN